MRKLSTLLRDWMLPLAIVVGISLYLIYHFIEFAPFYGGAV